MSKHLKPAAITIPDFVLAIMGDEVARTTRGRMETSRSEAHQYDGAVFFECSPVDGIMRDITADLAEVWWDKFGEVEGTVPDCFMNLLGDRQDALNDIGYVNVNAEHSTHYRGVGI